MGKRLYTKKDALRAATESGSLDPWRSVWRQDYSRLLHSASFRRLQGKKQLFPGHNSDFFRNRLTHSLEVAQVAKSIAMKLNHEQDVFHGQGNAVNFDIVETAALAHDLGHPPFGHNGEEALNDCMREHGGFEGNAQTLRILARLEKKRTLALVDSKFAPVVKGIDNRAGLNLTYRTLASILKYDREIPRDHCKLSHGFAKVEKGYYFTEARLVSGIKDHVVGSRYKGEFKTLECSIMDIADDIAYSTYDLEDSFKAHFLSPLEMISALDEMQAKVAKIVKERIDRSYSHLSEEKRKFGIADVLDVLLGIFSQYLPDGAATFKRYGKDQTGPLAAHEIAAAASQISKEICANGYLRTEVTSQLVGQFIDGVEFIVDKDQLPMSKVRLDLKTFKVVEVLKNFARVSQIDSPKLKISEHRGKDIVRGIFDALTAHEGHALMPEDYGQIHQALTDPAEQKRSICDFIASMTDRYAVDFYKRLYSTSDESIFNPL